MKRSRQHLSIAALVALMVLFATTLWAADPVDKSKRAPAAPVLKTPGTIKAPSALKIEGQPPAGAVKPGAAKIPSTTRLQPDLVITNVKITPVSPTHYDTITFSADVTNKGMAVAPASKVAVYIGGETNPVMFVQPAIGPNATKVVVREFRLNRVGGYTVKFVADAEGVVAESNEDNNTTTQYFMVRKGVPQGNVATAAGPVLQNPAGDIQPMQIVFKIIEESMLTYSFPGSNHFTFYLRPTKPVDTTTVTPNVIQVTLKYFDNGVLQAEQPLSGQFMSQGPTMIRWQSQETNYASSCTGAATRHCELYLTLQDSVMSQEGEQLDGNNDGQPGGSYQHQFYRGMYNP